MRLRWRNANRLRLLRNGEAYFPALLSALAQSRHEVFLESYIFRADETGLAVAAALQAAAQRGVQVCLLLDGFGAADLPRDTQHALLGAGVRLLFFRPEIHRFALQRQRLRRLHRKLVVVDGRLGFVGGINILNDVDHADLAPRYDYALQVEGPLVADLRSAAAKQWQLSCLMQLKQAWIMLPSMPSKPAASGGTRAALVVRDNLRHRRDIERAYLDAIGSAQHEIMLANAYFLPGRSLRRALLQAARRGVKVRLLLQGRLEHALLHYASRVLYRPFLQAGIEIHEYHAGFMHAKVGVIDRVWLTVGSSNIDPFSLLTAREANLVVFDHTLAQELRQDVLLHIERDARPVSMAAQHAPWWRRIVPWLAYQGVRLLLGITGYGRKEYRE